MSYPALLWATVLIALLGSFQFGFHLGILNTAEAWVAKDLGLDLATQGAIITSAVIVGAVVGSLFAGQAADALGPKKALLLNNAWLLVGCVLCSGTPTGYWGLLAGRALAGIGAGAASLYVPRYISEVSPVAVRGALTTLNQVFICVGILVAYLVGLPYRNNTPQHAYIGGSDVAWWRVMLALGLIPAALQAIGLFFTPESPVWLEWKGRKAMAMYNQHRLLGPHWQEEGEVGDLEQVSTQPLNSESDDQAGEPQQGGWSALFDGRYRRIMILASALPILQQLSGINTVVFYSSDVFAKAGLESPVLGSIIVGAVNVVGTLVAAFLMDHAGRRQLLLVSHVIMTVCLAGLAISTWLPLSAAVEGWISLLAVMGFVLGFSQGSGPIPWVYLGEILPSEIKGPAAALCTSLNWASNLVVGLTFPAMLAGLHLGGAYLVYAVINGAAVVFAWFVMVETKKRSLAQIQAQLLRSS
ncbi:g5955 [Coccomyxa viridis]|uniref:G5955 protein n=1 Tax=Coccomyxa viridis TaxID=1274662 RepID=A0ABP1FWH7_9CHLO